MTGERLKELNHPYTAIIHSSMKRAIETATAIHKHLPLLSMSQCDLLREGAPWPPEPPSAHWKPEYRVCGYRRLFKYHYSILFELVTVYGK